MLASAVAFCSASSLGTFASPSRHVRPKYRYLLPDSSVNIDRVSDALSIIILPDLLLDL